jgi:cell division protein FtsB
VAWAGCIPEAEPKVKKRARRTIRIGLAPQAVILVLVLGLVGAMAIQPTRQLIAQRQRIAGMADELRRIESLNDRLSARIQRLQDPDYIEQQARSIAGLVHRGETTFVVLPLTREQRRRQARAEAERNAPEPAPAPEPSFIEGFLDFVGLG